MAITTALPGGNFLTSGPAGTDGQDGRDGRDGGDGTPGRDGKDGRDGRDGAGSIITRTARTQILPSSVVVADGDFYAVPADITNPTHANLVLGISALGAPPDFLVTIQNGGDLDGLTGDFTDGDLLFPAANGTLTRVAPTSGWSQSQGRANTSTRMTIERGLAINLPETLTFVPVADRDAVTGLLINALTPDVLKIALSAFRDSLPELPATGDPVPGWYRNGGSLYEHKA